jgi:arsenite-transporting ATPase
MPRLRFFAGKGGAGKTTLAAAAAVAAAESGRRVLVVSTDPAHSLGDALARPLRDAPTPVPVRRGRLHAAELDARAALARWLRPRRPHLRTVAERGTLLDREDVDRVLSLWPPGADELVGLLELARLARERPYDEVVVDTAPTGHTLRLLAMPDTIRRVAAVLDAMLERHRVMAASLVGAYRPDAADAMVAELDAEAADLAAALRDRERAGFSVVLLPEPLVVEEARDAAAALEAEGMAVDGVVVNRVTPPPAGRCALCTGRVRAERPVLTAVRRAFRGRPIRLVPALPAEPRGVPALRRLARAAGVAPFGPRGLPSALRATDLRGSARGFAPARLRRAHPRILAGETFRPDRLASPGARLLVFGGKGGAGKTTCAAVTALALAAGDAGGRRVLLLSADPAHSLADVLGVPLSDDPRPVAGGPAGLAAREIDAEAAIARLRRRYREAVDGLFDAVRRGSRFDAAHDRAIVRGLVDLAPPGLDELVAVMSIVEALVAPGGTPYDVVVLDAAPTGHALRLLETPAAARAWVRTLLALLLKYRAVAQVGTLGADLVDLSRRLTALEALLRDPARTGFVVVTRAAELPRAETARLLAALRRLRIRATAVLVNAATPPGCARCRRAAAAERRAVAALRRAAARGPAGRVPWVLAPAVAPPPRGVRALRAFGGRWALGAAGARP